MLYWGDAGAGVLPIAASTGRILVGLRSGEVMEAGTWGDFGGKIEPGEDPAVAAEREFREETGYLGEIQLVPAYKFVDIGFTYQNYIGLVEDEFVPTLTWEADDYMWVTPRQLKRLRSKHPGLKLLLAHTDVRVREYIRVRSYKKVR